MTIAERMGRSKGVDTGQNGEITLLGSAPLAGVKRIPRDVFLIGVATLLATGSFGLGVIAGRDGGAGKSGGKVLIEKPLVAESQSAAVGTAAESISGGKGSASVKPKPSTSASGGQYVASKTGTKYYLPWCGSMKRIKEENKIWFASKAEAEAAGYGPAKNCKGL